MMGKVLDFRAALAAKLAEPPVPKWWHEFSRAMADIGARPRGEVHGEDVEFEVPEHRLEEAKRIIAKYMTPEARAEHGVK